MNEELLERIAAALERITPKEEDGPLDSISFSMNYSVIAQT